MKPTLRNSVKEVYKKSNNNINNYGFNNNLLNNKNNTSNNININNNNRENNKNNYVNNKNDYVTQPSMFNINTILLIIFFLIVAGIISAVIYFKDSVLTFIKNTFFKEETERTEQEINDLKNELEENQKNKLLIEQELEELRKQKLESESNKKTETNEKSESEKIKEQPKNTKKTKKSNEELRKLYSDNQFVKDDGFCYIGSDNNMRQCVEVYSGDICESGDVYNRIDKCLMPTHFKN